MKRHPLIIALFLLSSLHVIAQEHKVFEKESLRGLRGVYVIIEAVNKASAQGGFSQVGLRTAVEAALRKADIPVLTKEEWLGAQGVPFLYVRVRASPSKINPAAYIYAIEIQLNQIIYLERKPYRMSAPTWLNNSVGMIGQAYLRDLIGITLEGIDSFVKDYLAVNPKQ